MSLSNYIVGESYPELGGVYTGIVSNDKHLVLADKDNSREATWLASNVYHRNDWTLPKLEELKQLQAVFNRKTMALLQHPFSMDAFYWSGTLGPHVDPQVVSCKAYAVEFAKGAVKEVSCFHKLKVRLIKLVPRSC